MMGAMPLRNALARIGAAAALGTVLALPAQADVEDRLERIERLLESGALAEMSNRQEQLRNEVSRLTGELESTRREMEDLRRQQRDLYGDLDERIRDLESAMAEAPRDDDPAASAEDVMPDTPALEDELAARADDPPPEDADAAADAALEEDDPEAIYQSAFDLLRDGSYNRAADGFRTILDEHPDSDYFDNARYWLAETHYVVRDFDTAMDYFEAIVERPGSSKHPDAMLKVGFIHYERQEWDRARQMLRAVRDEYPDSTVATLAGNRLQQMDEEGR